MRILVPAILMLLFPAVLSAQRQVEATGDIQAVLLIEGAHSVQMRETIASRKGRSGVTASKQYFIFGGPKAAIRTRAVHNNPFADPRLPVKRLRFENRIS